MAPARVVLSYARVDGESLAFEIRDALEAQGLTCRLDHIDMQGGEDWRRQFENWVREAAHLVLVLTPAALISGHCAWEWQLARSIGRGIMPIRALPQDFPMTGLRRWMRHAHQYSFSNPEEQKNLFTALAANPEPMRVPDMADFVDLTRHVERPAVLDELRSALLDEDAEAHPVIVGLRGAAGYGKTEIAARVTQDPEVREAYFDGILHVKLGSDRVELLGKFNSLINALSGTHIDRAFQSVQEARDAFAAAVLDRHCLLILDDAWHVSDVEPFLPQRSRAPGQTVPQDTPLAPNLSVLITTRDLRTLPYGTLVVTVNEMVLSEALHMLVRGVNPDLIAQQEIALDVVAVQRFGRWPLLLQLGNGYIIHRLNSGEPLPQILQALDEALHDDGLDKTMEFEAAGDDRRRLRATIDLSIALLRPRDAATLYRHLAVFSLESQATVDSAARLWGISTSRTRTLCSQLNTLSLLRHYHGGTGTLQLHLAIREVLAEALGKAALSGLHQRFAAAWRAACGHDWRSLTDDYALHHLPMHLLASGNEVGWISLLSDPTWMQTKLNRLGIASLIEDYRHQGGTVSPVVGLIGHALSLSAGPLARDPNELVGQLLGRLAGANVPELLSMLLQARTIAPCRALVPAWRWLTPPGAELRRYEGHFGGVQSCAWSPDCTRVVSCADDGTIRLWDVGSGTCALVLEGHVGTVQACAWSKDGTRIVSGGQDTTLRLWDATNGTCLQVLEGHTEWLLDCAWSPDNSKIVSCGMDCTLRVWDANTGTCLRVLEGHRGSVNGCAWSPDGARIVSGADDRTLRVWDAVAGVCLRALVGHPAPVRACAWSPDNSRIASGGSDGTLGVWETARGTCLLELKGHTDEVRTCDWSADCTRIISGGLDKTLRIWDAASGTCLQVLVGHTSGVSCCAWSIDATQAISGGGDRALRLWDTTGVSGLPEQIRHDGSVVTCLWTTNGARVVSVGTDQVLRIWDARDGTCLQIVPTIAAAFISCTHSADGKRMVAGRNDNTLHVVNLRSHKVISVLKGHTGWPSCCAWSPDSSKIASGGQDNMIRLWNGARGTLLRVLEGHSHWVNAVAWSADGARIVSCSTDRTVRLWDTASGTCLQVFEGHTAPVHACAFSADCECVISGGVDNTIRLWSGSSGQQLCRFTADAPIEALAVNPDGRIAAGDRMGRVVVLDISRNELDGIKPTGRLG